MTPLRFKTVWRNEDHHWSSQGEKISAPEKLELIRQTLEKTGPILVEHWFYCGGCAPARVIFDDYEDFVEYLQQRAKAGDAIHVWDLHGLLREDNELVHGKCPAADGTVPEGGAY